MPNEQQNQDVQNLFDDFYNQDAGAGGVICEVDIALGYKAFSPGFKGADAAKTWFQMPPIPKGQEPTDAQAAQQAAVKSFVSTNPAADGSTAGYNYGVMVRQYRETAVLGNGKPVGWKTDQFDFVPNYTDACKSVVIPSLRETGIAAEMVKTGSWTGYVRLAWKDDPFNVAQGDAGKTELDKDNNPRFPQVLYISERFASESAAREAIGLEDAGTSTASTDPNIPTVYAGDKAAWESVWADMFKAKNGGATLPQLVKDYGADNVAQVTRALSEYIPL